MAVINNKKNKKLLLQQKEEIEARKAKKREYARTLEEQIKTTKILITKKAGENGKLFGSVTNTEIASEFQKENILIDKRRIEILKPIKVIGEHTIRIKLHESIQPEILIMVAREGDVEMDEVPPEEELKELEESQVEKPKEENE